MKASGDLLSCRRAELGGLVSSWLVYTFLYLLALKNLNDPL